MDHPDAARWAGLYYFIYWTIVENQAAKMNCCNKNKIAGRNKVEAKTNKFSRKNLPGKQISSPEKKAIISE